MVHDHQPPGDVELAEFPEVDMRHLRAQVRRSETQ